MSIITQLRSVRIYNIALFDLVASVIGLYLVIKYLKPNEPETFYWSWSIVLVLPIAVFTHYVLDVPTMLNYYLGLSLRPTD